MPKNLPELDNILHSGSLAYGKWSREFEAMLRRYIGIDTLMSVNSFASAFQVLFSVLDLQPNDEVIASPMACMQSNMPYANANLKVVWADINPNTGTLDPDSVRKKITSKTKLIVHNHFCGYPGMIDEINAIGKEYGILVLDDCIEAFGAKYKGCLLGNVGTDITIFSFQTVRIPNTIDGGAIVFKDEKLYDKALLCRDLGIDRTKFRDEYGEISSQCDISIKGYAATMGDVNSYIGCCQMDEVEDLLEKHNKNAEWWMSHLLNEDIRSIELVDAQPNYWVYGILSNHKIDDMVKFRENGYYASGVHLPNSYYSLFGRCEKLRGVEEFYSKFLALPCGWWFNNFLNVWKHEVSQ